METGTIINQYKIVSAIGKGGMGEVFLAEDTKLDRKVALKILPPEFAEDADRMGRFVREAKSASALNHPNIITIHEIGESNGTHFIATEFIDGQTLNDYAKANAFDYKSALEIATQIVSALDEAHQAGIVHRDIKPDNVMIRTNGLVKILDFGIAKLSAPMSTDGEAATAIQSQTQAGMIIGTPDYMSPEQARGRDVDHQTDIFSFGVVFYEMLSGSSPFAGETFSDVIAAVLTKEPRTLSDIPIEIAEILNKTLKKDKKNRYQTAKDLLHDLTEAKEELNIQSRLERTSSPNSEEPKTQILHAAATAETESQNSIAVLPFTNMSADEDNEYFCDGLAEELLNALSKIEDLKVAARTSAFSFKGKKANVSEIGEKLSVKNVLEGSVRKSGSKLRISVQLVNAAEGYQLWSERYDREMKDIFDVQDEIALAVVDALKVRLFSDEKALVLKRGTNNTEAYQLYLKGRFYFDKFTVEGFEKSVEYYKQALALEPNYAHAFAVLSKSYNFAWYVGFGETAKCISEAKAAVEKALALDESLAEAHHSLALIKFNYERDWTGAEKAFRRAIELNYAENHEHYAMFLAVLERFDEAIAEAKLTIELTPLAFVPIYIAGWGFWFAGRPDLAKEHGEKLLEMEPNFFGGHTLLGMHLWTDGACQKSIDKLETAVKLGAGNDIKMLLGLMYGVEGEREKANHLLIEFQRLDEKEIFTASQQAFIYAGLGEMDRAFDLLEQASGRQEGNLVFLKQFSSLYPKFHNDPRMTDLLNRLGLPTDQTVMLTSEPPEAEEPKTQIMQAATAEEENLKSIAVLPFTNISSDEENEYFCDGLAEELLNALTKLDQLKVAARTSAFSFKGKNIAVSEIARALGVKTILEGSARKSGNRLRVSVQLINASDGFHLWSDQYDREIQDVFEVQDDITLSVVDALKLTFFGDEKESVMKRYTSNPEAYQLYLKGRFHFARRTIDDFRKAIDHFEQAINLDSKYALAYVGIADIYNSWAKSLMFPPNDSIPQAKSAAKKALEIDPHLAEAHASIADSLAIFDWNWAESEEAFKRAIELNPNVSNVHFYYGISYLVPMGRFPEAIAELKRAIELEPLSLIANSILAEVYLFARQNDKALDQAKKAFDLNPNFGTARFWLGHALLAGGMNEEAIALCESGLQNSPSNLVFLYIAGQSYARSGQRQKAEQIIEQILEESKTQYVQSYSVARIYTELGDKDKAFAELKNALEQRDWWLPRLKTDPLMGPLRDDPRFGEIVKHLNLPQ